MAGLYNARPSDTDIRYDPDASDNLLDQSPIWSIYQGFWGPINFSYISDTNDADGGTFRQPELYNLTSKVGWPYKRDVFRGFLQVIVDGSRFTFRSFIFYPPAPLEFCAQEVPPGMANVVGNNNKDPANTTAVCGVNGNMFNDERFSVSSYERNAEAIGFWAAVGPVFGGGRAGRNPPGVTSFAKPVGSDTMFTHYVYDMPGYPMIFSNTETFLTGDSGIRSFASGTNAVGSPVEEGGRGTQYNAMLYTSTKLKDEEEFKQQLLQAYADYNITDDEIPMWLKNGEAIPSCLADYGNGCPTEDDYCGSKGIDPSCTTSPYQDTPRSMKPGAIAGFTILVIVVVALVAFFLHRQSVKKQKKRLRKQFAQQVAKRVDLRGSVSQLNPTDLLAEFKRIDQVGTSDGFISREELWEFVSSGKAGDMSEKDFNLLFDSMDVKGRGKVNFVEFCAFMSSCGEEVHELAIEEKENYNREEKLYAASRRLSQRKLNVEGGGDSAVLPAGSSSPTKSKNMNSLKLMHGSEAKAEVMDVIVADLHPVSPPASSSSDEVHEFAVKEKEGGSRNDRLQAASKRLSSRKIDPVEVEEGQEDVQENEEV